MSVELGLFATKVKYVGGVKMSWLQLPLVDRFNFCVMGDNLR